MMIPSHSYLRFRGLQIDNCVFQHLPQFCEYDVLTGSMSNISLILVTEPTVNSPNWYSEHKSVFLKPPSISLPLLLYIAAYHEKNEIIFQFG